MGKKHREERKKQKAEEKRLRDLGWRENENGELSFHMTKAEARRRFIRGVKDNEAYYEMRYNIIDKMRDIALADIQAQEDARLFEIIDRAL